MSSDSNFSYGVMPVVNNNLCNTYSLKDNTTGRVINTFCITGITPDETGVKAKPFTYDSTDLMNNIQQISENKLLGSLQIVNGFVILEVAPKLESFLSKKTVKLVTSDSKESKICDFHMYDSLDSARYNQAAKVVTEWFKEMKQRK